MEAEIINHFKLPSRDTKRAGQFDTILQVKVDGGPPVTVRFNKEDPTDKEIADAIKAEVLKVQALIGKKFTI